MPHHNSSGTSASTCSGNHGSVPTFGTGAGHGLTSGLRSIAGAAAAAASPTVSNHGAQSRALARSATTAGGMSLNGTPLQSSSSHGLSLQQQQQQPPSILLNPLESGHTPSVAWKSETREGKIVTKIPAVPSEKDKAEERARIAREKERQREKEREAREKEIQREKEKEKVLWGILPKKALMMGMSDINFNAQVAILGGWGNGSGTQTIVPVVDRKREKEKELERKRMEEMEQQLKREKEEEKKRKEAGASPEPTEAEDEILEPEELAAINAIINTRRSMEAAQALASGQVKMRRANSTSGSVRMRRGRTSLSEASPDEPVVAESRSPSASASASRPQRHASSAADLSSSSVDSPPVPSSPVDPALQQTPLAQADQQLFRSAKIRFAALPSPYEDGLEGEEYLQPQQLREEGPVHSALGAGLLSSGLLLGAVPFADQARAANSPERELQGDLSVSSATGMSAESSLMRSEGSAQTMTGIPIDSANRKSGPSSITSAEISAEPSSASSISESGISNNKPSSLHSMRSAASSTRGGKYMDRTDTMTTDGSEGSSEFGRWGKSKW